MNSENIITPASAEKSNTATSSSLSNETEFRSTSTSPDSSGAPRIKSTTTMDKTQAPVSLTMRSSTTGSVASSRPAPVTRNSTSNDMTSSFFEGWGNPDSILPVSNFDLDTLESSMEPFGESYTNFGSSTDQMQMSLSSMNTDRVPYPNLMENSSAAILSPPTDPSRVSSALHDAARITNWESVVDLCKSSPHLAQYTGPDKWTSLHHACNRRPPADVVEVLLRAYPDALLDQDQKGWTPLHHACRFKASPEVVRLLLKMYPSRGKLTASRGDSRGRPPLYYAIRYEAPDGVMEMLLEVDPSAVLEEDRNGEGPMFLVWDQYAMSNSGKRSLQNCLKGSNTNNGEEKKVALKKGTSLASRWEKVNLLLRAALKNNQGSDANGTKHEWRILHVSSAIKCHPTLFILARALHPEQVTEIDKRTGRTSLHCAAAGEMSRTIVMSLLDAFPEATAIRDTLRGSLPLHLAAENERSRHWINDGIRGIYFAHKDAIKTKDAMGRTPLHLAAAAIGQSGLANAPAIEESGSIISNLLQEYRDAATMKDNEGKLPFHLIAEHGENWSSDAEEILNANPNAVKTRVSERGNSYGLLPIHMAAMSPDSKPSLIENILRRHPRGATQADQNGKLPLHLACESGKGWDLGVEIIYGFNPSAVKVPDDTPLGWTPLHYAVASPNAESTLIKKLLQLNGGAAEVPDRVGRYALHLACASGKAWDRGVKQLFETYPYALSHVDSRGWLPIHAALMSGTGNSLSRNDLSENGALTECGMVINERENDYYYDGNDSIHDISKINTVFELLLKDPNVLHMRA